MKARKPLIALASVALALAAFELYLRAAGFEFHLYPTTVQMDAHGVPTSDMLGSDLSGDNLVFKDIYRADDELGWSPVPGYGVPGEEPLINALGFRGPAPSEPKPAGVQRIACLGDSCTFIGAVTYPELLQRELGAGYEVINAGVSGYSSYQGRVQLRARVLELQPDWVSAYFGWNDHWLARTVPDAQILTSQPAWRRAVEPLRIVQWLSRRLHQRRTDGALRVSLAEYRGNLTAIVRTAREHGAQALLLTAPWNVGVAGHRFLSENGNTTLTLPELHALHREYNQVVRDVAAAEDARLVDLARLFSGLGKDELFWDDGIHPNGRGYQVIASALAEAVTAK